MGKTGHMTLLSSLSFEGGFSRVSALGPSVKERNVTLAGVINTKTHSHTQMGLMSL